CSTAPILSECKGIYPRARLERRRVSCLRAVSSCICVLLSELVAPLGGVGEPAVVLLTTSAPPLLLFSPDLCSGLSCCLRVNKRVEDDLIRSPGQRTYLPSRYPALGCSSACSRDSNYS